MNHTYNIKVIVEIQVLVTEVLQLYKKIFQLDN